MGQINHRVIGLGLWTHCPLSLVPRGWTLSTMDGQITDSKHRRLFSVLTSAARQNILLFWIKNATLTTTTLNTPRQVFLIRIWTPTSIATDLPDQIHLSLWSCLHSSPSTFGCSALICIWIVPYFAVGDRKREGRMENVPTKKCCSVFIFNFFSLFLLLLIVLHTRCLFENQIKCIYWKKKPSRKFSLVV